MPAAEPLPAPPSSPLLLDVSQDEGGMKLLRFLERRLERETPKSALYKWIRTGQVRVNGGRARAAQVLAEGDAVRLPPFAAVRKLAPAPPAGAAPSALGRDIGLVAESDMILALAKPGGLACQPGTGQQDSLAQRLSAAYAGQAFIPAPAHRLDRHTSGLVLAGKTLAAQRWLHELFYQGAVGKWYLAWVAGEWAGAGPCLLQDVLVRRCDAAGRDRTAAQAGTSAMLPLAPDGAGMPERNAPAGAKLALSAVIPVQTLPPGKLPAALAAGRAVKSQGAALLLVRLLTGRRHQIRVQLASRGCPVIGDGRHGGPSFLHMLLHAYALRLPAALPPAAAEGRARSGEALDLSAPPAWPEPFAPDAEALGRARSLLDEALCQADEGRRP